MEHWSPPDGCSIENLQLLAEHCMDVIARVGPDLRFKYVSPSAERMFGLPLTGCIGRHVAEFVLPDDIPVIAEARRAMNAGSRGITATVRVMRGDGTVIWTEIKSRMIGDDVPGDVADRAVIMRDVSERIALEDELRAMAMKDGLTGVANRRAFDEALAARWQQTLRAKSHLSLLLIDIDHFKQFNDAYGHQVGDDCLRSVARALQAARTHPGDVVARYGGEELAIILHDADAGAAGEAAERVRAAVEGLAVPHARTTGGSLTVSVGAATALARDGGTAEMPQTLVGAADKALYQAKAAGRNCWRSALLLAPVSQPAPTAGAHCSAQFALISSAPRN